MNVAAVIPPDLDRRLSVAPMMRTTHRHFRWLMRRMTKHTLLYTEMQSSGSILHGGRGLEFDRSEHPLALQVGGSEPAALAACAVRAEQGGFDEININVGCPSSKVRNANFGACLFRTPQLVADCVQAMRAAAAMPVTVKTRIGVDEMDSMEDLHSFVDKVSAAGCGVFIIHARKAYLSGLNPKANRTVPPLRYDRVRQLKQSFPHLKIILNGGIADLHLGLELGAGLDGVMLGRSIVGNPWQLLHADQLYFAGSTSPGKGEVLADYLDYVEAATKAGAVYPQLLQPLLCLLHGFPGARAWRNSLATGGRSAFDDFRRQPPQALTNGG